MRVRRLGPNDFEQYSDFLDKCPASLVQHTLAWRDYILGYPGEEETYLLAEDERGVAGVLPSFIFRNRLGNILLSLPLPGWYGGLVTNRSGEDREQVFKHLIAKLVSIAETNDCLLATICTSPFTDDLALYRNHFRHDYERENFIQYLPLAENPLMRLRSKRRSAIRSEIRRASKIFEFTSEDKDEFFRPVVSNLFSKDDGY